MIIGGQTDKVCYRADIQCSWKIKLGEERYYKQKSWNLKYYICTYILYFYVLYFVALATERQTNIHIVDAY